ncbi:unnamed protein product, partial [Rangifer tarandus platyrhynchus]
NGLSFSSPKDLSDSGTEPVSPSVTGGFFTAEPPEKPMQSSPLYNSRTLLSPQKEISYSLSSDSPSEPTKQVGQSGLESVPKVSIPPFPSHLLSLTPLSLPPSFPSPPFPFPPFPFPPLSLPPSFPFPSFPFPPPFPSPPLSLPPPFPSPLLSLPRPFPFPPLLLQNTAHFHKCHLFLSLDLCGNGDRGIKWLPSLLTEFIRAIKNSHHPLLADPI